MLEPIHGLPDGVRGLRAMGKVSKRDYDRVLHPLLDGGQKDGRRLRFLYEFPPEFRRFTVAAAWRDARIAARSLQQLERFAVVSDRRWIRHAAELLAKAAPLPMRVFKNAEQDAAIAWLGSPATSSSLRCSLVPAREVFVVELRHRLRAEDLDALSAVLEPWIQQKGELRGLVVRAATFPGWKDLGSFLRHVRFVHDHHRAIRRVALAVDGLLAEIAPRVLERLVGAEMRRFDYGDVDRAIAWAGPLDSSFALVAELDRLFDERIS